MSQAAPEGALPYAKMNGIGNAILVVDLRGRGGLDGHAARRLGGVAGFGFDQLMAIRDPRHPGTDAFVDIFNRDGSVAGACGNGTRCVAWFLLRGQHRVEATVETAAGLLPCRKRDDATFTVDMGAPRFGWRDVPLRDPVENTGVVRLQPPSPLVEALGPASVLSMGNPHAVFWPDPARDAPNLGEIGPVLERHPLFPERANISFARVEAPDRIRLDVWERGAGLTRACGSAACATLVASARRGVSARDAEVVLPGGALRIAWRDRDGHVLMTGPVELEHEGTLRLDDPDARS